MVSRLKGIETQTTVFSESLPHFLPLDMVSRLKGIETNFSTSNFACALTLDMVSRLKGIETFHPQHKRSHASLHFGYGFPFEGNWNKKHSPSCEQGGELWIWFPVWRELKQRDVHQAYHRLRFGYGFPFEGNWNDHTALMNAQNRRPLWIWFPVWRELKRYWGQCEVFNVVPLDMLSRLKGIETKAQ